MCELTSPPTAGGGCFLQSQGPFKGMVGRMQTVQEVVRDQTAASSS